MRVMTALKQSNDNGQVFLNKYIINVFINLVTTTNKLKTHNLHQKKTKTLKIHNLQDPKQNIYSVSVFLPSL